MSAAIATERTAKERVRRTRSRRRNELAPLRISQLATHEYDLDPACISLVCPSCRTWVPINRPNGQPGRTQLVPHHTEKAGTANPVTCTGGSHRRVIIDVEVEKWRQRVVEGVAETDGRRSNWVTRKPKVAVAPAVMQILSPLLDVNAALKMYEAHTKGCATCAPSGRDRCVDGGRLAHLVAHKRRTESAHRAALTIKEEQAEQREQGAWLLRDLQWASTAGAVRRADLQRVHDELEAMLKPLSPKTAKSPRLNDWERADVMSAITMLATKVEQLSR
ncbi:hypothetical protein [Streptomyces chartreusis]|uniref:Uncharacterized protein n=1 Tax=Streptomyces chartreusis TaxID=1969 RepID=A0A7H8T6I8_STRCX|nr:hypothetical protein [Streptomyces chartreusis]QKZ18622.1 hypothetical protein HUT05_15345 [Streptomyces chartreusis]